MQLEIPVVKVENLIIGAGYGGSVAALRLAEAGHNSTILEMGTNWIEYRQSGKKFASLLFPHAYSTWLRRRSVAPFMNVFVFARKRTGMLDRMKVNGLKLYAGRGSGGGSMANGGMAVQPKRAYFEEILPTLNSDKFWHKYFPLAQRMLQVNTISISYLARSKYYKYARLGMAEAEKAGYKCVRVPNVYSFDYMQKEEDGLVPKSALNREVIYGNNYGKQSLDKTYLKQALATGRVDMVTHCRVIQIAREPGGGYSVLAEIIDEAGNLLKLVSYECKKLFLNAGSLGTAKIILRSIYKRTLPPLPDAGKYWGNNGNIMLGRNFVNTWLNRVGDKGFRKHIGRGTGLKQSTIPVAAIDNWQDGKKSFFVEISPLPMGLEAFTALYLMINRVPQPGTITYNAETDDIDIDFPKANTQLAHENARQFVKTMREANGGTISGLLFDRGYGADICYHPLGGMALGKATDNFGRVKNCPGMYVTDASLIPGSIGVNPFLTVTALAEYCMEEIISKDF